MSAPSVSHMILCAEPQSALFVHWFLSYTHLGIVLGMLSVSTSIVFSWGERKSEGNLWVLWITFVQERFLIEFHIMWRIWAFTFSLLMAMSIEVEFSYKEKFRSHSHYSKLCCWISIWSVPLYLEVCQVLKCKTF